MSPSESDLRAALHDGEGRGGLNVDQVIGHAQAAAAQRRVRLMSGAAIMAVVLGTGVGIGYLSNSNTESAGSSSADNAAGGANAPQAAGSSTYDTQRSSAQAGAVQSDVPCPGTFPNYQLPGGGGLSSYGANEPMFSKSVTSVVVCGYGDPYRVGSRPKGTSAGRLVLTGTDATTFAASIENAPTADATRSCSGSGAGQSLVIIGVAADGSTLQPATATLSTPCLSKVTNGTAVRYNWKPPENLRDRLLNLSP